MDPGIQDLVDLILLIAVHHFGKGRGNDAARKRVGDMGLQQADMEHRVDLHGRWKL